MGGKGKMKCLCVIAQMMRLTGHCDGHILLGETKG